MNDVKTADAEIIEAVIEKVNSHPRSREIMLKTLMGLEKRLSFGDAELMIMDFAEYPDCLMNPAALLGALEKAGGLRRFSVGMDGMDVASEELAALDPDAADDLIDHYDIAATVEGLEAAKRLSPENRYRELMSTHEAQRSGYEEVLRFCAAKKRRRQEIEALVKGKEYCRIEGIPGAPQVLPSHFIEKLEKTGMLEWDNGWKASAAGLKHLSQPEGGEMDFGA